MKNVQCSSLGFFFVCLFLLVRQNVHKGHWKDPFPLWLSFDVANLQHRRKTYIYIYTHTRIRACVHIAFIDCMYFIQKRQNCTESTEPLQVLEQFKADLSLNLHNATK